MGCGIPFYKLDQGLKTLLQRGGVSLGDTADLKRSYIPMVRDQEYSVLKEELANQWFSVIFDGTTRCGEVLSVVVRFCTQAFEIKHRLIALRTAAKHMSGAQLSAMIVRILIRTVGVDALDRVLACTRDSCSTNGAALTSLKLGALPNLVDVLCFSHTLHNCAKHMNLTVLESWLTPWFHLMSHSHAAKAKWRAKIEVAPKLFSQVRWWSRMECAIELAKFFGFIAAFLEELQREKIGEATTNSLISIWSDEGKRLDLQLDLAVMLDAVCFCESTYRLEGDRLEMILVWEEIEAIRAKGRMLEDTMSVMPNVAALLRGRVCCSRTMVDACEQQQSQPASLHAHKHTYPQAEPHTSQTAVWQMKIQVGTPTYEWFGEPYNKWYGGRVTKLPTAAKPDEFEIKYDADGGKLTLSKLEVVSALDVRGMDEWVAARESLAAAFEYLEDRLTDAPSVDQPYRLGNLYAICSAVRVFNPEFIRLQDEEGHATDLMAHVSELPWIGAALVEEMRVELPYLVTAVKASNLDFSCSRTSIADFSSNVLAFWRNLKKCPTWQQEARRAFCLTPNSAASERVFSLMKAMFNDKQIASLSDHLEGSVMLAYNERQLG